MTPLDEWGGLRDDLEYAVVDAVADVERTVGREGDAVRLVEFALLRRAADAVLADLARPGEADDHRRLGRILADAMVVRVGDDDVAGAIDAEVLRAAERRLPAGPAVAAETFLAGPDDGANAAVGRDDPHGVAAALQDVDVAGRVRRHGPRVHEGGVGRPR